MPTPVTMPVLGLTMEEGTVAEWLKHEGDTVQKDEPLLLVEMDKGTQEVPSPAAGVLRRIVVQPGTTVPVKTLIAEIAAPGEATTSPEPSASPAAGAATPSGSGASGAATPSASAAPAIPPVGDRTAGGPGDVPPIQASPSELAAASSASPASSSSSVASPGGPAASSSASARAGGSVQPGPGGSRLFASPRARLRARELRIELQTIRGTGPHGRIVEADVLASSAETSTERFVATPLARRLAQEHGVSIEDVKGTGAGGRITQEDVLRAAQQPAPVAQDGQAAQPLSRLRRLTAERMATSAAATARVTLFLEADFSELARFRQQLQPELARVGVEKLPWDALIAKAAALALVEHRGVLAQWVEGHGLQHPHSVNVGVAVALEPEGLVVPVLRDADRRSLRELASDLLALADKARAGRLGSADMQGGGFTITNLGGYRIDGFTPIVNPPETAILGVGRVAPKAVVVDGKVEVRTMCTLSLSFDHRVVDGAPAAAFLARLAELLERPYALLGI